MTDKIHGWQDARVFDPWARKAGTVVEWAPYGAGMNDALVCYDDGSECWTATHTLRPILADGSPDSARYQTRREAVEEREAVMLEQLQGIRANLIADWSKPWPGCDFGKVTIGQALNAAIASVTR